MYYRYGLFRALLANVEIYVLCIFFSLFLEKRFLLIPEITPAISILEPNFARDFS